MIRSPARRYRSAEEVSRLAQFVDAAAGAIRRTSAITSSPTTTGARSSAWASISRCARARDHKVTLDDYMRRMWQEFGRVSPPAEGAVARPYTHAGSARRYWPRCPAIVRLPTSFFDRFVQGREVVDYAPLLARGGLDAAEAQPGPRRGSARCRSNSAAAHRECATPTMEDTPVYAAGLDRGDELLSFDGVAVTGRQPARRRGASAGGRATRCGCPIRRRGSTMDAHVDDCRRSDACSCCRRNGRDAALASRTRVPGALARVTPVT